MNKKSKKQKVRPFFWGIVFVTVLLTMGALLLTSTRAGMRMVTKKFLPEFIATENIEIGELRIPFSDEIAFEQLELRDLKFFPAATVIRIQRLMFKLKSLNPRDAEIDFDNIRVFMPYSDPIVLSGHIRGGHLAANIYSSEVSIEEVLSLLPRNLAANPNGRIQNLDLYLEGPLSLVSVRGTFFLAELNMPKFKLSDAPGDLTLALAKSSDGYSPKGSVRVTWGRVKTKNALLKLDESRLNFFGSFVGPSFDIKGSAGVGNVDIDVVLAGTPQAPQWKFLSNPPLPEEVLMLMFLTGKNVGAAGASVGQKKVSPDVAKDLVDYFLLGGEGGRLAQKLGIRELSIIYDKETAGIGVKKEVTDFLDVGYQVEQKGGDPATSDIKHTLGAEFRLDRHFSVEVDKELYQFRNQQRALEPLKTDDKIYLKYKTRF